MLTSLLRGGAGRQVHWLSNELSRRGHKVTVVAPEDQEQRERQYEWRPIPIRTRRLDKTPIIAHLEFAARISGLPLKEFDVLHAHGWEGLGAFAERRRMLVTVYGSAIDELGSTSINSFRRLAWAAYQAANIPLERAFVLMSRYAVGISPATTARYPTLDIIPCGVPQDRFVPLSANLKSQNPTILAVGTTYKGRKRLWMLHKIFEEQILPAVPDAELWMVTNKKISGKQMQSFTDVSETELVSLYGRAWVFCLPSTYEGFGVPYVEAMSCGTAVVATSNAGAEFVLGGGEYGLIVRDEQLADSICELIRDPARRNRLAQNGLVRAAEFSMANVADAYSRLYRRIVDSAPNET